MIEFRPVNPERPLAVGDRNRKLVEVIAINPPGVVCEESIFVNAVTTLGIPLVEFFELRQEKAGVIERVLCWRLEDRATAAASPAYTLKQLRDWWHDSAWLAANPAHELAIIHAALGNMMRMAARIREQPHLFRVVRETSAGRKAVHIPSNATPAERERLLATLAA